MFGLFTPPTAEQLAKHLAEKDYEGALKLISKAILKNRHLTISLINEQRNVLGLMEVYFLAIRSKQVAIATIIRLVAMEKLSSQVTTFVAGILLLNEKYEHVSNTLEARQELITLSELFAPGVSNDAFMKFMVAGQHDLCQPILAKNPGISFTAANIAAMYRMPRQSDTSTIIREAEKRVETSPA